MIGKTVELRLVIFRARSSFTIHRFTTRNWRISPVLGARVDGLHTTPPPASYGGEAMKAQLPRDRGGRPRRGVGAGESGAFPRCGLRRSTETAVGEPPTSTTKYLSPGTRTR
jgi:hypothetical protein